MNGIQEVSGSIPLISTKSFEIFGFRSFFFTLRVFQAYKQQWFDPAYLHQNTENSMVFGVFLLSSELLVDFGL